MTTQIKTFYGTFPRNNPLHMHFVAIRAHDIWAARETMAHWYQADWSEVYEEERLLDLQRAGMSEVKLGTLRIEVS